MQNLTQTVSSNVAGTNLSRYVVALCQARGALTSAAAIAEHTWPDSPAVHLTLRAAISAMGTGNTASLMSFGIAQELVGLERTASVQGRLYGFMRKVPLRVKVGVEVTASQAGWAGEGMPKAVSAGALDSVTLDSFKSVTMVIFTSELVRFATPNTEQVIRQSMQKAIVAHLDSQFLDPLIGPIAQVRPGSITFGAAQITSTGSTAAQITADLQSMLAAISSYGYLVWIMRPATAIALAGKTNSSGNLQFPLISILGGTLLGLPVIVSSSAPATITLLDASDVLIADDLDASISFAQEASILMDSDPGSSPMHTELVSLWQRDLVGILVERSVAWARAHSGSAAYMSTSY